MKRVADRQLSKDDGEEDDEVEEVGTGFKKADESVLASRPIRGLPKRSLAGSANPAGAPPAAAAAAATTPPSSSGSAETTAAPPRFSGFSGFGTSATSASPFSFAAPAASSNPPKPASSVPSSSPFSFSSTTNSQTSSLFGTPVSSSASPATKAFASIVSSSSSSTPTSSSTPAPLDNTSKADDKDIEYYKALRGLNVSLLSAISKAIEADPFADVAELLERYKSLRISVASRDDKSKTTSDAPSSAVASSASAPKSVESSTKPAPPPSFTMPAPPSSFTGFKPSGSSAGNSNSPSGSGFMPKIDTSGSSSTLGSPFSFASSKPAASESATTEAPKSAFTFASSSSLPSQSSSGAAAPFSFGAPSSSSSLFSKPGASSSGSVPSFFGTPAPSSSSSVFGGSIFGKSADTAKDKDAGKAEDKDAGASAPAPSTSTSTSSSFFGSGSGAGSNPFATSTPEKGSNNSGFSFGSASPGKGTFFGGLPKAGSIGNPVGFGFGSPPKTPEAESASGPVKSLPFSFGAPKPAEASEDKKDAESGEKEAASSGEVTPAPDAPPQGLPASTSVHDQEGEGEENEVTTHEIRSKVYKMTKDKDGNAQWGDLGVGILRLKKNKDTDSRRMLLRNSSTGKITINFIIYTGMNASVADKTVSFIGHEDGHSTPYRIRCKTAAQANELKAALDREIEFVKAKSEAS